MVERRRDRLWLPDSCRRIRPAPGDQSAAFYTVCFDGLQLRALEGAVMVVRGDGCSEAFYPACIIKPMGVDNTAGNIDEQKQPMTIGTLASGEEVIVTPKSHFYTHPETHELIGEALTKISLQSISPDAQGFVRTEVELEGKEGKSNCVPITEKDKLVFAKRAPRPWYTRFAAGREPMTTNKMSLILQQQPPSEQTPNAPRKFKLFTAFWGPMAPREPSDTSLAPGTPEYEEAEKFWKENALVLPDDETGMAKLGIDPKQIKEALDPDEQYFRTV